MDSENACINKEEAIVEQRDALNSELMSFLNSCTFNHKDLKFYLQTDTAFHFYYYHVLHSKIKTRHKKGKFIVSYHLNNKDAVNYCGTRSKL